jgi:hypothetical protein
VGAGGFSWHYGIIRSAQKGESREVTKVIKGTERGRVVRRWEQQPVGGEEPCARVLAA